MSGKFEGGEMGWGARDEQEGDALDRLVRVRGGRHPNRAKRVSVGRRERGGMVGEGRTEREESEPERYYRTQGQKPCES